jgi:uncharacterized BrkB/YihY/UPF0761 family membrane protein
MLWLMISAAVVLLGGEFAMARARNRKELPRGLTVSRPSFA